MADPIRKEIEKIYKAESGRVLASLMRILGDLDTAEEALQESFYTATEKWPEEGVPKNPYAWLVSVGNLRPSIRSEERSGEGSF